MLDKVSVKLLKALYKKDLPEEKVNKIMKIHDAKRPDTRIYKMKSEDLLSVRQIGGIPDGEGGYLDGTVKYIYHIEPNGRAEVERVRKSNLKWLIGTGIALLSAIGAILSVLSNWAC